MTCRHTCVHARATHARPHLCDACACTRKHSNGRRVLSTSEKGTLCADMVPQLLDKLDSSKSAQVHDNVSGALIWFLSQHGQMHWYVTCTCMPSVVTELAELMQNFPLTQLTYAQGVDTDVASGAAGKTIAGTGHGGDAPRQVLGD